MIGIDISRYQGQPDFKALANEIDFVIMQAGFGKYDSQKDSQFERNYAECEKYNIHKGVYWYSYATNAEEAKAEAEACLRVLKGKRFDFPIYIDVEESLGALGRARVSSIVDTFCSRIEKDNKFAGIYISRSPAQSYLTANVTDKYALWLAEYADNLHYDKPVGIWQYSSTGRVNGISGDVDMDKCYVNYPDLIVNAGLNGYTKPAEQVLDKAGYIAGDKSLGVYFLKCALKAKGYKLDDTSGFGKGTCNAVNDILAKNGFKPNGTAGKGFARLLFGIK